MPPLLSLIPILLQVGTSAYAMANQPSMPKTPAPTPEQQAATALKTRQTQENAIAQQLPGLQSAVGGSLSPEALLKMAISRSGQAGDTGIGASMQDLITKMLAGNSTVSSGGLTGGINA